MIAIQVDAQANALGMLRGKFSLPIGKLDGCEFFIIDGKVWKLEPSGAIHRSDDSEESAQLRARVQANTQANG